MQGQGRLGQGVYEAVDQLLFPSGAGAAGRSGYLAA